MRPFCESCVQSYLPLDHLGKFDGKADEGFFVGYSTNSKAFRVFNSRTRIVEENMHCLLGNQSNGSADHHSLLVQRISSNAGFQTIQEVNVVDLKTSIELPNDPNMPELEDIVYSDDDEGLV
ncbi:ribonuclease H-like domain-containing protein [Tanacetum coccineum]